MSSGTWQEWTVGGALIESPDGLLLVRNVRRGGAEDWSPPGGVIDAEDGSLLAGLAREVEEETGLRILDWHGPVYRVSATAPDMGWQMHCEVHHVAAYEGEIRIEDPDGIVVEAAFVLHELVASYLEQCPIWVRDPLTEWLAGRCDTNGEPPTFAYEVHGRSRDDLRVVRRSD